ncbi:MAG: sigma-70 family RNA polymerase sigma factor [Bacteroidota bacterium]
MHISDELIQSCKLQNRRAQKQLYELLLPYLRAIASRYLRDTSYVKDALQESFVKVFKHLDQYDPQKAALHKWAAKIVVNACLNYNKRIIGTANEELDPTKHEIICFPQVMKDLSDEHVLFILKQMPLGYFEVFNLFVIDGYHHDEIAELLQITEGLSRQRLSRARAWLKKTFRDKADFKTSSLPFSGKIK